MINFKKITDGLRIKAKAILNSDTKGELEVDNADGKISYHNGTSRSPIVTESHTATLTNKTLTSPVINSPTGITKADVGLGNVDNTSDATKNSATATLTNKTINAPDNTITNIADSNVSATAAIAQSKVANLTTDLASKIASTEKGAANGVATLGADSKIPSAQLPAIAITDTFVVASQVAMLALTAQTGDIAVRSDLSKTFILQGTDPTILGNWVELQTPADVVQSVNGQTGVVTLTKSDVGLGNVDNTSDATKNSAVATLTNKTITGASIQTPSRLDMKQDTKANLTLYAITAADGQLVFATDTLETFVVKSGLLSAVGGGDATSAIDNAFAIKDSTDNTKQIKFDAAGTTGTSTTIAGSQTANRVITLPDITDTVVTKTSTDTLTNKTLTSPVINSPTGITKSDVGLSNVDNTSDATKNSATATLTNKTIDTATNTISGLTVSNLAAGVLDTDLSTVAATDTTIPSAKAVKTYVDNEFLNTVFKLNGDEGVSGWTTGNSATFLASGTISGTFASETSTPLHGASSYKFTQAAGSLNDWIASPAQAVDLRFRGQQVFIQFPYQYNGSTNDIQVIAYDVTNSAIINTTDYIVGTNGATSTTIVGLVIPLTCASIKFGLQVKVLNSGKILSFDDVQMTSNIDFITSSVLTDVHAIEALTATTTWGSTNTGVPVLTITKNNNNGILRVDSSAANGTSFVALKDCVVDISSYCTGTGANTTYITKNATTLTAAAPNGVLVSNTASSTGYASNCATQVSLTVNDVLRIQRDSTSTTNATTVIVTATAPSSAISTPTQTVSSDTMSFVFKSTAIDPNTDAIGTFNTYTIASGGNVSTIATTAPTQTTSSMNINGIQLFSRAFNATSTSGNPTIVDIFIGKGLKSTQVNAYGGLAKTLGVSYDRQFSGVSNENGVSVSYTSSTGILRLDAGSCRSGSTTTRTIDELNVYTSAYFEINASKSPSLTSIPQLQPRIAYLAHQVSSGTAGPGTVATTWTTRTLNTIVSDSTGIVTSLASNQFILSAGTYDIFADAQENSTTTLKLRLRNITAGTTAIVGDSTYSAAATTVQPMAVLNGQVTITSATTFELQYWSGNALGSANASSSGEVEQYAMVKITKIK